MSEPALTLWGIPVRSSPNVPPTCIELRYRGKRVAWARIDSERFEVPYVELEGGRYVPTESVMSDAVRVRRVIDEMARQFIGVDELRQNAKEDECS